jgi:hypothetical protein
MRTTSLGLVHSAELSALLLSMVLVGCGNSATTGQQGVDAAGRDATNGAGGRTGGVGQAAGGAIGAGGITCASPTCRPTVKTPFGTGAWTGGTWTKGRGDRPPRVERGSDPCGRQTAPFTRPCRGGLTVVRQRVARSDDGARRLQAALLPCLWRAA